MNEFFSGLSYQKDRTEASYRKPGIRFFVFAKSFVGGSFLPFLILLLAALVILLAPVPALAAPAQRVIRVEAGNYAFTPGVVSVNPGDSVTIELVAKDVAHGLSIDGYPVDLHAEPGQTARATFTASRPGTFKLRCSVACGNLHPFMTGKFQVGPNLLLVRAAALLLLAFAFGAWSLRRG